MLIIALFAISLSANTFTKYELDLANNGVIGNYNLFIKRKNDEYIKKAYNAKREFLEILNKKDSNDKYVKQAKNTLAQVPVFLQYCVVAMLHNNKDMITGKCYDMFRNIEADYGYAQTSRETTLENLVERLSKYYEYNKAKKVGLWTLKLYPKSAPTLYNISILYMILYQTLKDKEAVKAFKNKTEFNCFFNKTLLEADRIGKKTDFYAPANYIRNYGLMENSPECKNYNFRKKLQELIKKEGF